MTRIAKTPSRLASFWVRFAKMDYSLFARGALCVLSSLLGDLGFFWLRFVKSATAFSSW